MLEKEIVILGIVVTTIIAFIVALILASASNQVMTQIDEHLDPITNNNPQVKSALETRKTLDDVNDLNSRVYA